MTTKDQLDYLIWEMRRILRDMAELIEQLQSEQKEGDDNV